MTGAKKTPTPKNTLLFCPGSEWFSASREETASVYARATAPFSPGSRDQIGVYFLRRLAEGEGDEIFHF